MEINDLDALAALVERMDACGCPGAYRGMKCVACVSDMNWVIAAAPDLLRLARIGLQHEATFRYGYRLGVSRFGPEETEDDVVRLWQHKEAMEAGK